MMILTFFVILSVSLFLGGCCLGPDGAEVLGELITKMATSLKVLSLETAELEDDGVGKIASALAGVGNNTIEVLRLGENELEKGSIDALLDVNLPKLKLLSLKDNMELEELDEKKQEIKDKFSHATVCIDDDDNDEIIEEKPDEEVDALAAALGATL